MQHLVWQVGRVRITRIPETEVDVPTHHILPDARGEALAPHRDWLSPHFLRKGDLMPISIHGLVIEAGGRRILVDPCSGEKPVPGWEHLASGQSAFLERLEGAGFARESFDTVLCTHLHFDHVGWNTMRVGDDWVPTFPNAEYLFGRAEYTHWRENEAANLYTPTFDTAVRPVVEAGLARFVEMDHRVSNEVRLEPTPGHTPGHVAVHVESDGERAMITGDLTHHPVQWAEPGWSMPADTDAAQAIATRERLLAEHADSDLLVIGTHYPAPTAGHIVRHADGHRFRALE